MDDIKKSLPPEEEFIDLREIIREIWKRRFFVAKIAAIGVALSVIYALTAPEEFESKVVLVLDKPGSTLNSNLSGLASLAGINISSSDASLTINPLLFSDITRSKPYGLALLNKDFTLSTGETMPLREYLLFHSRKSIIGSVTYGIKLPLKLVKKTFKNSNNGNVAIDSTWISLTEEENFLLADLQSRVILTIDETLGTIQISSKVQDKIIAAQITQFTFEYLTNYVLNLNVSKQKNTVRFIETQLIEAQEKFLVAQKTLANFRDENRYLTSSKAQSELDLLNSQYNLTFGVYNSLSQQLEQAKIRLEENKPLFQILEPVNVPLERSEPQRTLIVLLSAIISGLIAVAIVFSKILLQSWATA